MIRKTLSLFLCAVMLLGVMCGCKNNPNFTVDEILEYMNEKYDEEFTYIRPADIYQPTSDSFEIFVASDKYPDDMIYAKCLLNTETGEKRFCDNYVLYIYEDEVRDLLTELTQEVYADAKVRYAPIYAAATDSSKRIPSLEQYLSRSSSSIDYMILLPDEHDETLYKEELNALCMALKEKKVVCDITIAYSNDRAHYDSFVTDKWPNEHVIYKLRGDIGIGEDFEIELEEWR